MVDPPAEAYGRTRHDLFLRLGLEIAGHRVRNSTKTNMRNFRGNYGSRPDACAEMWDDLKKSDPDFPQEAHPRHLFWTLMFMKSYDTSEQLAGRLKKDMTHIRPWVKDFGRRIQAQKRKKIRWSNCDASEDGPIFILSVDGVHCSIQEHKSFEDAKKHCSHKSGKAAFACEIAISIWRSKIVWINGPFRAGINDSQIFESGLNSGHKKVRRRHVSFP